MLSLHDLNAGIYNCTSNRILRKSSRKKFNIFTLNQAEEWKQNQKEP